MYPPAKPKICPSPYPPSGVPKGRNPDFESCQVEPQRFLAQLEIVATLLRVDLTVPGVNFDDFWGFL